MVEESRTPGAPSPIRRRTHSVRAEAFRLPIGEVVARSVRAWLRNLAPFFALAILLAALLYLPMLRLATASLEPGEDPANLAGSLAVMLPLVLLWGGLAHTIFRQEEGKRVGPAEALLASLRRVLPVLVVLVIETVLMSSWFLAGVIGPFGIALAFVPFVMTFCALFVAVPACVVEGGVVGAVRRSLFLTRNNRLPIFAVFFTYSCLHFGVAMVIGIGLVASRASTSAIELASNVLALAFFPLLVSIQTVTYQALRLGKEGVDVQALAAVFE